MPNKWGAATATELGWAVVVPAAVPAAVAVAATEDEDEDEDDDDGDAVSAKPARSVRRAWSRSS